jgi:ribose-phosphate pyrophosphokinase
VLSDPAIERLAACGAGEIVLTNTLPIPPERMLPNLTVLSIGPLVAQAIHEVFKDGSVTSLFSHDSESDAGSTEIPMD